MKTPKYTFEIFDRLSKGQFICSNSTDEEIKKMYEVIEQGNNFEILYDYFSKINFNLCRGDEYFFFTRPESKVSLEHKLESVFKWIDIVDLFKTYDNSFSVGFRFTPAQVISQLEVNSDLKNKLNSLHKYHQNKSNYLDSIKKIIDMLKRDNYVELVDELTETYKVLSSFSYLEELILAINIPEEILDEIPE
ncbi:MAG: hypothetical protein N4A49_10845 [Marinifilaceae bacterium]|jgi:hypothetical protein|nr:hypothetical protein [Marinifilaceae bacterium]